MLFLFVPINKGIIEKKLIIFGDCHGKRRTQMMHLGTFTMPAIEMSIQLVSDGWIPKYYIYSIDGENQSFWWSLDG